MAISKYQKWNEYVTDIQGEINSMFLDDQDYGLGKDPKIYRKVRRDPVIAHALDYRENLISGREWTLEAGDEESKPLIAPFRAIMKKIPSFKTSIKLLSKFFYKGMTLAKIEWEEIPIRLEAGRPITKVKVPKLTDVDKRRLLHVAEQKTDRFIDPFTGRVTTERRMDYKWQIFDFVNNTFLDLEDPWNYIWVVYANQEDRFGWGEGIMESVYFYWFAKTTILKYGLKLVEKFGSDWVVMGVEGLLDATQDLAKNNPTLNYHRNQLIKMRGGHAFVIDKDRQNLDLKSGGGQGNQIITNFLNYLDNQLRVLILGSNLPTSATSGGSFALAQVQENSTEALIQFDREVISEAVTKYLVSAIWRENYHLFSSMGYGNMSHPRFKIVQDKREDPSQNINIIVQALSNNIALLQSEVYSKLGFTQPTGDDEVFGNLQELQQGLSQIPQFAHFSQTPTTKEIGEARTPVKSNIEKLYNEVFLAMNGQGKVDPNTVLDLTDSLRITQAYAEILGRMDAINQVKKKAPKTFDKIENRLNGKRVPA